MHVALLSPAWPLAAYPNGIVTYVHWMTIGLRRAGHEVTVLTSVCHGGHEEGVQLLHTTLATRLRLRLRSALRPAQAAAFGIGEAIADSVASLHRAKPVDVLEMEESFGWPERVARRTGIPLVVKLHGPAFMSLVEEELDTPLAAAKIEREGQALRALPVITSPARRTLDETMARYRLAPAVSRHIVNPLSLPATAPVWRLDRCDPTQLLFVGRFDKRKGGDIVLQAFAALLRSRPELTLVLVGPNAGIRQPDGRLVHFAEMANELFPGAASNRVRFLGPRTPDEIYLLRAQALVTIVASRWENQSYTALEAMLQGCPLVSSDAGGQGEIVIDGVSGLLARAGSADDLSRQLLQLVEAPARAAELGRAAREYALSHHAPERVVRETLDVYREAITLAGRRPTP